MSADIAAVKSFPLACRAVASSWDSLVKFSLSCSGSDPSLIIIIIALLSVTDYPTLPHLSPGYSQSKSMPSQPKVSTNLMTLSTNVCLLAGSEAISDHCSEPEFQPPMERKVFRAGFFCLSALNRL